MNTDISCDESLQNCIAGFCDPNIGECVYYFLCDDHNPCTNDVCNNGNCENGSIPGSVQITLTPLPAFCQGAPTLDAIAQSFVPASYQWSNGETSSSITPGVSGIYSVTAADANGCTFSNSYNYDASSVLSNYTVLASQKAAFTTSTVFSGGVGVRDYKGSVVAQTSSVITAPSTFAKADIITVNTGSTVAVQIPGQANVPLPPFETSAPGGISVVVNDYASVALTGSSYQSITVGVNATVTFTSSVVNVRNITAKVGSKLKFAPCTKLRVLTTLNLSNFVTLNPDNYEVIIFASTVFIGGGSTVRADIFASGSLSALPATAAFPTIIRGLFIAQNVYSYSYTHWVRNTGCLCNPGGSKMESEDELPDDFTELPPSDDVLLKAYPNPFKDRLSIEFMLYKDSKVSLELFNMSGQRIATLYQGNARANEINKVEFLPEHVPGGILIYRLSTEKAFFFDKAVMVR